MIRVPPLLVAIGAVVVVSAAGCGSTAPPPAAAVAATKPVTVEVAAVVWLMLNTTLPLPGELQPYEGVAIYPKVQGFVASMAVDRGSVVTRGQVLATLDAPELVAERAQAQAKVLAAQGQFVAAQAKLASDDSTYQHLKTASATPGVVAGADLEVSRQLVEADRAQLGAQQEQVNAARQAVQSVSEMIAYLEIKAPIDGVVTERNVHPGALVGPPGGSSAGVPMFRVEVTSRLRLVVPVPEAYVAAVRNGLNVDFSVPAYPGRRFSGMTARVAHSIDVKTRTMAVEIDVMNTRGELASGSFAEVRWPVERREPSLFVPPSAVASTLDRTFVVRIDHGKVAWVDVRTGVTAGKLVEVFGDLHAGDQVAVRGTDELHVGASVTPHLAENK